MDVPEDFDTLIKHGYAEKVPHEFFCLLRITEKGHKAVMDALDGIAWKNIVEAKNTEA